MLKVPDSLIVYEIKEGENRVPFIGGGKKYGYTTYIERYDPIFPMMGFLNHSPELRKYFTLEQYKNGEYERRRILYEESKTNDEEKRDYYLKTQQLANDFAFIYSEYSKTMLALGSGSKKFAESSANKNYLRFVFEHSDLFDDNRSFRDIRFQAIVEDGTPSIKFETKENVIKCIFYEIDPLASYEKFLELAIVSEEKNRKYQSEEIEENINDINSDYYCFLGQAKKLLETHDKVGLVYPSSLGREVYVPKRMKNKTAVSIEQFTVDDFINAELDTIYWFE